MQRLLAELKCLPQTTQLQVLRELSQPGWLQRIEDDVLEIIMRFLDGQDRIALLDALHRRSTPRATATALLAHRLAAVALLEALCVQSLSKGIAHIADKILFSVPSCFSISKTYVFADWTPFKNRKARSVAAVRWSTSSPHARCDIKSAFLREFAKRMVRRHAFAVRLTAHVEQLDAHPDACYLCVDRRPTAIFTVPIHCVMWSVFDKVPAWMDARYMQTQFATGAVR